MKPILKFLLFVPVVLVLMLLLPIFWVFGWMELDKTDHDNWSGEL